MKKSLILFAAIVMMAGFTTKVMAQATVTGTTAGAKIIVPLALTQTAVLHMGTMSVLAGTAGTCILSTNNIRTTGGAGGVTLSAMNPPSTNAAYHVVGEPLYDYAITLPASINVSNGTPADDMLINALTTKCLSESSDGLIGTLLAVDGDDDFTVGGTLNVAAGQTAGVYAGAFNVTVNYY